MDDDAWLELFRTFEHGSSRADQTRRCLCVDACADDDGIRVIDGIASCARCGVVFDLQRADPSCGADDETDVDRRLQAFDIASGGASLGTAISSCRSFSASVRRRHKWVSAMDSSARRVYRVLMQLEAVARAHGVPCRIVEQSRCYYRDLNGCGGMPRGKERVAVAAACLYISLKSSDVPRTVPELCQMFACLQDDPKEGSRLLLKAIKRCQDVLCIDARASTPVDYINRFGCQLGLDSGQLDATRAFARSLTDRCLIADHSPDVVASACLWVMSDDTCRVPALQQLARVCHVSQTSVQNCARKIRRRDQDDRRAVQYSP